MVEAGVKEVNCKEQVIREFIQKDLEFDEGYEESLKKLYFIYKSYCTRSFPLGKLLFKSHFLKVAKSEGHQVTAHSTNVGVIFEGIAVRLNN